MSVPTNAQATDKGRFYAHPKTGELFPSVTTILGVSVNKPALVGWAARETAIAAVEWIAGHEDPAELKARCKADPDAAVKWLKGRPYAKRDSAANLGSRVHALAEGHTLGDVADGLDDDERAMFDQYLLFVLEHRPVYEASEATVINRTIGYAGTLDGIVRIPALGDGLHVVDFKTGKTGPYDEWALQLAAYAGGEAILLPNGDEIPMPEVAGAAVLRIRPKSYGLHPVLTPLVDLFETFRSNCAVADFMHTDADVFGPAVPAPGEAA